MEVKIILGVVAALLAAGSAFLYIRDIYRGNTKPHVYTWLIWAIVTVIGFFGSMGFRGWCGFLGNRSYCRVYNSRSYFVT